MLVQLTGNKDVWQLLNNFSDPQRPFITTNFSEPGRIELSVTTFINGAAKAANAFRDVIEAEPGTRIVVDLGWSWQQAVWQAGALIAGNELVTQNPDVSIVAADQADGSASGEVFGISTDGWGRPQGCSGEITAEVMGQPDGWMYPEFFDSQLAHIAQVRQWGQERGVSAGARVGMNTGTMEQNIFVPFLLPLVFGGSVVLTDKLDDNLVAQEQITCVLK
jgi:uncharacterized protein (TIGR03089 family)